MTLRDYDDIDLGDGGSGIIRMDSGGTPPPPPPPPPPSPGEAGSGNRRPRPR